VQPAAHDRFLDGLRGVAILTVVAGHSPFIGVWLPNWGRTGVYLFFVLSGFLLSRQLHNAGLTAVTLTRYFVARAFRIYPPFIPVLAYLVLVGYNNFTERMPIDLALRHLTLQEGALIYWTIVVEFQFYFILPVLIAVFALIGRKNWRVSLGLALVLMALSVTRAGDFGPTIANHVWLYLPCFLFGTMAGLWAANVERISLPAHAPALALLGIWLTLPTGLEPLWRLFAAAPPTLDYFYFQPVQGFLWTIVLLGGFHPFWRGVFENLVLCFYGRISYSLYLIHTITWSWLFAAGALTPAGKFPPSVMIVLYVCVPTLLAYLSHRFFEEPTIALGKRVGSWLTGAGFARPARAIPAPRSPRLGWVRAQRLSTAEPAPEAAAPRG
jgi:peptidoglycan/LPS O-acetylase OafA/YrhL